MLTLVITLLQIGLYCNRGGTRTRNFRMTFRMTTLLEVRRLIH